MSTRSIIAIQRDDDKYEAIYCHSDGYLTYNGAMLVDHYKDKEKVEKLIELGDISCLAEKVEPDPKYPHSFDYGTRQDDVVVAYTRDRGDNVEQTHSKMQTLDQLKDWGWIEYIYIFDKNNQWQYTSYPFTKPLKSVEEDLKEEYRIMGIKRPKDYYGFWTEDRIAEEKKRQNNQDTEM